MILPGSYSNGFAPRDGQPLYPELWRGCVGAWAPCLGPTGLTLRDWSGFANHGVLTNMTATDDWLANNGKYALDVDGINDYVLIRPLIPARGFAFSCWFRAASASRTRQSLFANSADADPDIYLHIESVSGATNAMNFYAGASYLGASSSFTQDTNWHHYAWNTLQNGQVQYFRDGVQIGTAASSWTPINDGATNASIGAVIGLAASGFTAAGLIDDCMRFSTPLAFNQIRLLSARRGIAYELAPRRRASVAVAAFNRRRRLLVGAGS